MRMPIWVFIPYTIMFFASWVLACLSTDWMAFAKYVFFVIMIYLVAVFWLVVVKDNKNNN